MKALLDTSTLLMIVTDDIRLSAAVRAIYLQPDNDLFVSMAAIWELALKINLGKIKISQPLHEFILHHIRGNDIKILNIELPHILTLEKIPVAIINPFTRLVLSQCICENIPLLSNNEEYDSCPVTRIW